MSEKILVAKIKNEINLLRQLQAKEAKNAALEEQLAEAVEGFELIQKNTLGIVSEMTQQEIIDRFNKIFNVTKNVLRSLNLGG